MNLIMKFGGTSLGEGKRVRHVAEIIGKDSLEHRIVAVASAMNGVTDELISLANRAREGEFDGLKTSLNRLYERHVSTLKEAVRGEGVVSEALRVIDLRFERLISLLSGISILREVTPRALDSVTSLGEGVSASILWAALSEQGAKSVQLTGGEAGIVTDDTFGDASPLMNMTRQRVRERLLPLIEKGIVPVVCGFAGVNQAGEVTTLGRGGSDNTAAILASALDVDEVWLWTDVDGLMTADPRVVRDARVIPEISYAEANEMAFFGVKGMHPRALEPISAKGIPVRVRNTFNPTHPGTLITKSPRTTRGGFVKAVAHLRDVGMINVEGAGMVGKPGTAARVFDILGRNDVNILMISQSVSESSISIIVRREVLQRAVSALEIALLGKGVVGEVKWSDSMSIVAVLGEGMKGTPGVAARVFGAVARRGVNLAMIAQGSSELNISFAVEAKDSEEAERAVHEEFGLGNP